MHVKVTLYDIGGATLGVIKALVSSNSDALEKGASVAVCAVIGVVFTRITNYYIDKIVKKKDNEKSN